MNRRNILQAGLASVAAAGIARAVMAQTPSNAPVPAPVAGQWSTVKPIPEGGNEVVGANVNGRFVTYGGLSDFNALGQFYSYDPKADTWVKLPAHPLPIHHTAAVGIGNRFYLFGGLRKPANGERVWMPVNECWAFDFDTMKWAALAPMPTVRGALAAVAVGNRVHVIGGSTLPDYAKARQGFTPAFGGEQAATHEIYDVQSNQWTSARPMLTGRNHHGIGHINGKIYVVGGRVGSAFVGASTNIAANEAYDIATDTWLPRALLPTSRSGVMCSVLDGRLHAIGGEGATGPFRGAFKEHEVYDPPSNTWLKAADMLTPRHAFAIATIDGRIYTATGMDKPGTGGGPATGVPVTEVWG
jgi:N-acetylneuraminic acid mutarotase